MFRCQLCQKITKLHEPMTKEVVERYEDGNIKREIAICTACAGIVWPPVVAEASRS
jgi:uncharacterized protein with PIN domain